jgi:hypothetical protein
MAGPSQAAPLSAHVGGTTAEVQQYDVLDPLGTPALHASDESASSGDSGPAHENPIELPVQPAMLVSTVHSLKYWA